jgi:hypothetical protein
MNAIDDIYKYLEYINRQNRFVSLVNTYHGVSISLEVDILKVSKRSGDVTVATRHGQNISLLPATKVLIHSDLFPKPIQAKVASVDVHHRQAVLRNLVYPKTSDESRKETRVHPKEIQMARVLLQGQPERVGRILDISVEGISIALSDLTGDLEQLFIPKTSVRLFFDLPRSDRQDRASLSYRAIVSYLNAIENLGEFRLGFMTFPSADDKSILRRYIFDRQTELFNEISQEASAQSGSSITL